VGRGHCDENLIQLHQLISLFRFLLASLHIEEILQEPTMRRSRGGLSGIADGLGLRVVCYAAVGRVGAQAGCGSPLGMGALMWISYPEGPLGPDELCHALAIEISSNDFNADNIPSMATLVGCCQGLISVDREVSRVRLIHFTLREYFSAHAALFSGPHSTMAEICLTYLNSHQVKALPADFFAGPPADPSDVFHDKPFLKYCSLYWSAHTKRIPLNTQKH